jgi:hypothetical protein
MSGVYAIRLCQMSHKSTQTRKVVIAGLDPAIQSLDARVKAGHDTVFLCACGQAPEG